MQTKEPVEVESTVSVAPRPRDGDGRASRVVGILAERHDHVEAVDRTTLKDGDEDLVRVPSGFDGPSQERRCETQAQQCQAAVLHEDSS